MGFPCGSDGKESTCNVGDLSWEIPWSRAWQPTPVFFLENLHVQRRLVGYSPWGHKELDMTEQLSTEHILSKIFSVKFGRHDFKNILLVYPKSP